MLADPDRVEMAAAAVEDQLGPIDVWVNDAMVTVYAEFLGIQPEEFRRATEVSYLGMVWGPRAALKRMLSRDRGSIVQVCSAMSYRGIPLEPPYCGAKHACKGFTESVLTELRRRRSQERISMIQLSRAQYTPRSRGTGRSSQADDAGAADLSAGNCRRCHPHAAHHRRRVWRERQQVDLIEAQREEAEAESRRRAGGTLRTSRLSAP
jgi:NAD(P)-dependent dehydrogenase (short-subunit alcohol dehydrogenase family)